MRHLGIDDDEQPEALQLLQAGHGGIGYQGGVEVKVPQLRQAEK